QIIHKNPSRPVRKKDHSQPYRSVTHGTTSGVTSAPTFVPELKRPVASARSFFGNHSATVLIDAGKLPASPSPSRKRMSAKPAAAPDKSTNDGGSTSTVGRCKPGNQVAMA